MESYLLIGLICLAILGNYLYVDLFFSVSFIFGSISTMLAVYRFGTFYGAIVAIIASSYTYWLWGHPYAIIIFFCEAVFVGQFLKWRRTENLVVADSLYWCILGMALIWYFYRNILGMTEVSAFIILIKQPLNGIVNALITTVIIQLNFFPKLLQSLFPPKTFSLTTVFNNSIALFVLVPMLSFGYFALSNPYKDIQSMYEITGRQYTDSISYLIEKVIQTRLSSINSELLPALVNTSTNNWDETLFRILRHEKYQGIVNVVLLDQAGNTEYSLQKEDLDFNRYKNLLSELDSPKVLGLGNSTTNKNSYTLAFAIPIMQEKILIVENKVELLSGILKPQLKLGIRLIDSNGNLVLQNKIPNEYVFSKEHPYILQPDKTLPSMVMWINSYYMSATTIERVGLILESYLKLDKIVEQAYMDSVRNLVVVFVTTLLAILLAPIVTRRVALQINGLTKLLRQYPNAINNPQNLEWPNTEYTEIAELKYHFKSLITSVSDKQEALINSTIRAKKASDELQQLIYSANAPIFGVDSNGKINEWNRKLEELTGYKKIELMNHDVINNIVEKAHQQLVRQKLNKALKGMETQNFEMILTSIDKKRINILLNLTTRLNMSGEVIGVVGVGQDITERKIAEAQLIQSSKLATLGEMATGVAHELNQPLNVISMAAGNIIRRIQKQGHDIDPKYLITKSTRIVEQAKRAAVIIDHMRMFGRRTDDETELLNINDCVYGALSLMGEQLRLHNIIVKVDVYKQKLPLVKANKIQVEQVILNLLANARDAVLTQEKSIEPKIWLLIDCIGSEVKLTVEDTGGGIPKHSLEKIFEPFYTTKEVGKGTGLGLSVSYGIIQRLEGRIEVINTKKGARFDIFFPISKGT